MYQGMCVGGPYDGQMHVKETSFWEVLRYDPTTHETLSFTYVGYQLAPGALIWVAYDLATKPHGHEEALIQLVRNYRPIGQWLTEVPA